MRAGSSGRLLICWLVNLSGSHFLRHENGGYICPEEYLCGLGKATETQILVQCLYLEATHCYIPSIVMG